MFQRLLDLLFPLRSLGGVPGVLLTDRERTAMTPSPVLLDARALRLRQVAHLDRVAAGCLLDTTPHVRAALHRLKYRRDRALVQPLSAFLDAAASRLALPADAALCPVPLHWSRLFARGFNQSELLARALSARTGMRVMSLLRRRRATGTQTKRTRDERRRAMRNAFVLRGEMPAHVVLVDDVATTLSTLDACACALKRAGVQSVDAVAVALG